MPLQRSPVLNKNEVAAAAAIYCSKCDKEGHSPEECTFSKKEEKKQEIFHSIQDPTDDHEDDVKIYLPIGKLGAITRVRKQIEARLFDVEGNKEELKSLYTIYLTKVEALYSHCQEMNDTTITEWVNTHKNGIEEFMLEVSTILYPKPKSTRSKTSTVKSTASERLAAHKSKLTNMKEHGKKVLQLEMDELKLKEQTFILKKRQLELQNEEAERETELLEQEVRNEVLSQASLNSRCSSPISILQRQPRKLRSPSPTHHEQRRHSPPRRSLLHQSPSPPRHRSPNYHHRLSRHCSPTTMNILRQNAKLLDKEFRRVSPVSNLRNDYSKAHNYHFNQPSKFQPKVSTPYNDDSNLNAKIVDVLQRQGEISENMVKFQLKASLPKRELNVFDGSDITEFKRFIIQFERIIENTCQDDGDRLLYLQQYTSGRAGKLVNSCSHYDESLAYAKAKQLLYKEFDNEFLVSNSYLEKLNNWPVIPSEDPKAMEEFALFLSYCENYLENMTIKNQLQSPKELVQIANKLPYKLRDRWRRKCHDIISKHGGVYFRHLVEFVRLEAEVLNQPLFGEIKPYEGAAKKSTYNSKSKLLSIQTDKSKTLKECKYCNGNNHYISSCKLFSSKTAAEKSDFVRKSYLCYGCLRHGHMSKNCPKRSTCYICKDSHPTILHDETREKIVEVFQSDESSKVAKINSNSSKNKIISPIIPVKVKINNKEILINCALDTCASDCWMNDKLLKSFNIYPTKKIVTCSTMSDNK